MDNLALIDNILLSLTRKNFNASKNFTLIGNALVMSIIPQI